MAGVAGLARCSIHRLAAFAYYPTLPSTKAPQPSRKAKPPGSDCKILNASCNCQVHDSPWILDPLWSHVVTWTWQLQEELKTLFLKFIQEVVTKAKDRFPLCPGGSRKRCKRKKKCKDIPVHDVDSNFKYHVDSDLQYCTVVMEKYKSRLAIHGLEDGPSVSRCNLCSSFSNANSTRGLSEFMKLHLFIHARTNPFCCRICGKSETTNPSKVRAHIKKCHPEKREEIYANIVDRRLELNDKLCILAEFCFP